MTLATSTLLILLIILPGFLFSFVFFSGDFDRSSLKKSALQELGEIVGVSIFIHSIFIFFINSLVPSCEINFKYVINLLWSSPSNNNYDKISDAIKLSFGKIILYNSLTCLVGVFGGLLSRVLIRECNLDLQFKSIRFANPWFYTLTGQTVFFKENRRDFTQKKVTFRDIPEIDAVFLDVMVKSENENVIYRGFLRSYALKEGTLESISISNVTRRKFNDSTDIRDRYGDKTIFYSVPGFYLVILATEICNINLNYQFNLKKN